MRKFLFVLAMLFVCCPCSVFAEQRTFDAYYNESGSVILDIYGAKKPKTSTEKLDSVNVGNIFIGDSRLIAINNVTYFSEIGNNFIVAEAGQGYTWFVTKCREKIKNIVQSNPNYDKWSLIICLGINDLRCAQQFATAYKELAENYDVYLISVLPVDNEIYVKNNDIIEFNKVISKVPGTSYINLYNDMLTDGFSTVDGLHYDEDTNKYIWHKLRRKLNLDWKTS